jgi:hypothetical protein
MSANTKTAEAISFASVLAPMVPYCRQPDRWLGAAGMTDRRYDEEMDIVMDCFSGHLHPVIDMMNDLPETPELRVLRAELNAIIRAPFTRPQNPVSLMQDMSRALVDVIEYYHTSRSKKLKSVLSPNTPGGLEGLKEISPTTISQRRAMVLLKILKARPGEALHTEDCKRILEGAEGVPLDPTVVRRGMCVLAELYNPRIVYEILGGSSRVRVNF